MEQSHAASGVELLLRTGIIAAHRPLSSVLPLLAVNYTLLVGGRVWAGGLVWVGGWRVAARCIEQAWVAGRPHLTPRNPLGCLPGALGLLCCCFARGSGGGQVQRRGPPAKGAAGPLQLSRTYARCKL